MHRVWTWVAVLCLSGAAAPAGENSKTLDNLKAACQGAVDAKVRHAAFAEKAEKEGYRSASALFRAAADAEAVRITKLHGAMKELGDRAGARAKLEEAKPEVKSTKENLEQAVKDLAAEKDTTLPAFVKQANADKDKTAAMVFKGAEVSDGELIKFCNLALGDLDGWKAGGKEFLVCQVCSFVSMDKDLKQCPYCSAPRTKLREYGK